MVNRQNFWKIFRWLLNIFSNYLPHQELNRIVYSTSTFELQMCIGPIFTSNIQHTYFLGIYFGIFSQLSANFVILWDINTIFLYYTMQHVLCLYVLFRNWHQWTDSPKNWHSVSTWPWQYFRICSTLVLYPFGYLIYAGYAQFFCRAERNRNPYK